MGMRRLEQEIWGRTAARRWELDTSVGGGTVGYPSDFPYIGAHLPIAPGDPHWTPPPSLSGPHNRAGDPARPGYDSTVMPMDLSSIPGMTLNSVPRGWQ